MRVRTALLFACGFALAACSDDPTAPKANSGALSFSYTGAGASSSATFSADGSAPSLAGETLGDNPWALGFYDVGTSSTIVTAVTPKTSTTWDVSFVQIDRTTVGTSSIDTGCDFNASSCTGVVIFFGLEGTESTNFDSGFTYMCALATGTVNVTTASATNIAGTFSGSGSCVNAAGDETPFTIANGTFNVSVGQVPN
jgi:hypothetical protein